MIFPAIALLSSAWLLISLLYFGTKLPAYRHVKNTISEVGEVGSSFQKAVGYGVFLPVGVLLLAMSLTLYFQGLHNNYLLGLCGVSGCVGIGYVVAALFPCDPGSPLTGSTRQQIHNFGGVIEYLGGSYFLISTSLQFIATVGYCVMSAAVAMSFSFSAAWRGLIQRIAELGLFAAIVFLSIIK